VARRSSARRSRAGCRLHYWLTGPVDRPLIVLMHDLTLDSSHVVVARTIAGYAA